MREFQDWTRAEIRARFDELAARKLELDQEIRIAKSMKIDIADLRKKGLMVDDPQIRRSLISIRRNAQITPLLEEQATCSKEQQRLNAEIHIRDSPKLVKQLGAGRD